MKYQAKKSRTRQVARHSIERIIFFWWSPMQDWASDCRLPAIIAGRLAASRNIYLRQELCAIAEQIQAKYQDRVPVLDLLAITAYEQVFFRQVWDSCPVVNRLASLSAWAHSTRCHQVRAQVLQIEQRKASSSCPSNLAGRWILIDDCSKTRNPATGSFPLEISYLILIAPLLFRHEPQLTSMHPIVLRTKRLATRASRRTMGVLRRQRSSRAHSRQRSSFVVRRRVRWIQTAAINLRQGRPWMAGIYHRTKPKRNNTENREGSNWVDVALTREGPQVCSRDFNENDVGLLSQVCLSQVWNN